jgi:hypothetical protein
VFNALLFAKMDVPSNVLVLQAKKLVLKTMFWTKEVDVSKMFCSVKKTVKTVMMAQLMPLQ